MKKKSLPSKNQKLKPKQIEILLLLYKFYYLNRKQIQILLKHKYFHRIIIWLNELAANQYIVRNFTRKFGAESAVYSLGLKARKELKKRDDITASLLNRVYREKRISTEFKKHTLFLADIYLSLLNYLQKNNDTLHFYTKTDLYGMEYLITPFPDAYLAISKQENTTKRYFLDIFDENDSRGWYKKRVMQYITYYENEEWQTNANKPFPEIILACHNVTIKQYVQRFIKKKLQDDTLSFHLATWEEIQTQEFLSKLI